MTALSERYGPNWREVKLYLDELRITKWFERLGEKDCPESAALRLYNWSDLATVGFDLEDEAQSEGPYFLITQSDDIPFMQFLKCVVAIDDRHSELAEANGLARFTENAAADACEIYVEQYPGDDYFVFNGAVPESVGGTWEYMVEAHVSFIATEIAVSHLTTSTLLRDMWYWYRRGHWPCGWQGNWPEGQLIVF